MLYDIASMSPIPNNGGLSELALRVWVRTSDARKLYRVPGGG